MSLVVINFPIIKDNYFQSSYLKLAPFQHLMTSPLRSWKNRCSQAENYLIFPSPDPPVICYSKRLCLREAWPFVLEIPLPSLRLQLLQLFLSATSVSLSLLAHFHNVQNHMLIFIYFYFCLCWGLHCCSTTFSGCGEQGLLSSGDAWTSHCSGFSLWSMSSRAHRLQ